MVGNYDGQTFVAFLDVLGFGELVENNVPLAAQTLDKFYSTIYDACSYRTSRRIAIDKIPRPNTLVKPESNAIVASDCAVVFSNNRESGKNMNNDLECMLEFVRTVNCNLIKAEPFPSILTTCSVAFGLFFYEERKESSYLKKNCFLGTPYMNAFSDSEKMKREPGLCRLLGNGLPDNFTPNDSLLVEERGNYYFYWMLQNRSLLESFQGEYTAAIAGEKPLKYERVKEVIAKYSNRTR
jgi:hypothetical protein